MPTVLRQFPQVNRIGNVQSLKDQSGGLVQRTAWAPLTAFDNIRLEGQASAATLGDPTNAILFIVLASAIGSDADANVQEIQREFHRCGMVTPKGGGAAVPSEIDITFNLAARNAGWFVALEARFLDPATNLDKTINIGATLTGLP